MATAEILAGVLFVIVLDPESQIAHVFSADEAPRMLGVRTN
jgi:hypothetical protein